jgi:hypothetical protein
VAAAQEWECGFGGMERKEQYQGRYKEYQR